MNLTELLNDRTVRAKVAVDDWRAAVEQVGHLLVDVGAAEPRYIDAMKALFTELGTYAVIAPGIAMPHARPEQGAIGHGFALITLAQPVDFGSSENDPVDLVVAFAAVDKEAHVSAIAQLARLLSDADLVAALRRGTTTRELLDAVAAVDLNDS